MRAFVTGGHGFVGPWLVEHLRAAGDEVVAADPAVDVTDPNLIGEAMSKAHPDAVYHLAAQSNVQSSWSDTARTFEVNASGTLNVMQAALACRPPPRVLLVSSAEVYGAVPASQLPVKESAPFQPVTPYAASKAAAEMIGLQAYLGAGLEVVRARPFNHTGAGQRAAFVIPALARRIARAGIDGTRVLTTGNLAVKRDVTDVRDVVRAYRRLIECGTAGEPYNICSGRSVAIAALAQRLVAMSGLDLELRPDPDLMRPVDVADVRGDPARIREATGWQPEIDLDRMLADVLAYWLPIAPSE